MSSSTPNVPAGRRDSLLRSALGTAFSYCPGACAAALIASSGTLGAQSISVNLASDRGAIDTSSGALPAGAINIGGEYWNNASGSSGTLGSLVDSTGATTGASINWSSNNTYFSGSPNTPTATSQNAVLTEGYLDDSAGISITLNSPYLLNDVYVIHATDQGDPATMSAVSVNGTWYKGDGAGGTILASGSGDSWSAQNWSSADTLVESSNYLYVGDQAAVDISLLQSSPGRAAVAGVQVENAYAGTLSYWDVNGATAGSGDTGAGTLNGTWGSDTFWSTDELGGSATSAWTSGHAAVFSAGADGTNAHTITVSGTQTADAIWVQEGDITLTGGTLDLTGSTGILRNDDAGLSIDSTLSATDLTIVGSVSLNNSGNTISGNVDVASGTLNLGADQAVGSLSGGGTVALGSQTLSAGDASDFAFNGTFTGGAGSVLEKTGTGTMTLGSIPNAVETLDISAGTLAMGSGTLNSALAGSGTFYKSSGGNFVLNSTGNTGFTGQIRVNGGIFRFANDSSLGAAPGSLVTDAIVLENGARLQGGSSSSGADVVIDANRGIVLDSGSAGFHA